MKSTTPTTHFWEARRSHQGPASRWSTYMSDVLLFLESCLVHGLGAIPGPGPLAELGLLAAVLAVVFIDDLGHVVEGGEDDPEAEEHEDDGLWRKREVMMTKKEEGT